jgi:cysteine desulfurase
MVNAKFFPIYLDHGATTPVDPEVFAAMQPYFTEIFGNPSSIHSFGVAARKAIGESRVKVAKLLGADPNEIIFTGSGTESDNIAILGTATKLRKYGTHVITTTIEHPAVRNPFKKLAVEGFDVTYITPGENGIVSVEEIKQAIRPDTILISVMYVNNEIGTIQPIKEIGELASEKGIIFHTDAVQAVGKIPINLTELKVDLLSASGHKFYGPKGTGLLFYRNAGQHPKFGKFIQPIQFGGGHEASMRPATENTPGIVGFAKALEITLNHLPNEQVRLSNIRDDFISWVLANIPNSHLNGDPKQRLFNNINFRFDGLDGNDLLAKLDAAGIAVSTGSACSSKSADGSYVIRSISHDESQSFGTIRMTLGKSTTIEMMDYVKNTLKKEIEMLRASNSHNVGNTNNREKC